MYTHIYVYIYIYVIVLHIFNLLNMFNELFV